MNKKTLSVIMACTVAFGVTAFAVPAQADAASKSKTPVTVQRAPGQSMVLSMEEVATIFLKKYPDSAVHSIALQPENGQFNYKVQGYTLNKTYSVNIDCITGEVSKEVSSGKTKDLASKIFNPANVIDQHKAEAIAVQAVGEGAVAKGWELSADKGLVTYAMTVTQGTQQRTVTINAKDGAVLAQSEPVEVQAED